MVKILTVNGHHHVAVQLDLQIDEVYAPGLAVNDLTVDDHGDVALHRANDVHAIVAGQWRRFWLRLPRARIPCARVRWAMLAE